MIPKDVIKIKLDDPNNDGTVPEGDSEGYEKHNYGTSALYGRTQKNVTFHQRGAYDDNKFESTFPAAYFSILKAALKMASMFFRFK